MSFFSSFSPLCCSLYRPLLRLSTTFYSVSMVQSVFQFILKLFNWVEVRALCKTLEFFYFRFGKQCLYGLLLMHMDIVVYCCVFLILFLRKVHIRVWFLYLICILNFQNYKTTWFEQKHKIPLIEFIHA